jgi:sugar phosphate isomerase/epimerase
VSRLALQLYTVRDECAADFPGALGRTASLGFEGVELHDLHGRSAEEVRGLLDRHGLEACARHTLLEAVEADPDGLARELEALGTDRLVVAWIPPPGTAREADAAVERLVAAADRVASLGVRLGFHNHDGELALLDDGTRMLDRLLAEDVPLFLELDLGWAWYAGVDPFELVARADGRVPLVHVKDLRRADGPTHVALGDGEIDYEALGASAAAAGVEWLVVEQDETDGQGFEAVARSVTHLLTLLEVPA